jgi:hypothetical protein
MMAVTALRWTTTVKLGEHDANLFFEDSSARLMCSGFYSSAIDGNGGEIHLWGEAKLQQATAEEA